MLIINDASAAGVPYWQRSAVHTTWLGRSAPALGLAGEVDSPALRDVLRGRRPGGDPLTERPRLRRRQGWDLVFGAPKSVSLLALSGAEGAADMRGAFRLAVRDAFAIVEDNAAWARRAGSQVRASGLVAGAFEHVGSDAGQPHLHAHVVLANLAALGDGRWGCLVGNELWRWREGIGPAFHLALRSRLNAAGFAFEWEVGAGGLGEIVGVPRSDRLMASSRSLALRASARSFGSASAGAARTAQARTRAPRPVEDRSGAPAAPGGVGPGGGPASGFGREQAAAVLARARRRPALPAPPPSRLAVERALAERGSTFAGPDVLVALAETCPSGLGGQDATEFSRRWCETSLPATGRRWTSGIARRLDDQVLDAAVRARGAHLAEVSPAVALPELAALGFGGQTAELALRLACAGEGISVVPPAPWLAQAACLDAARAVWQANGVSVQVSSPSELSERRWRALTSLRPARSTPGAGRPATSRGGRVLVVDAADHLSPAALARLCGQAGAARTKLVLVAGGTVPGTGASVASSFDRMVEDLAPLGLMPATPPAIPGQPSGPAVRVDGLAVRGALTGADALAHLVTDWRSAALPGGHGPGVMVAFGAAEVDALNHAGRRAWMGADRPPVELVLGDRAYAVGDEVLALRRLGSVRSATRGTVVAVDPPSVTVRWRGTPEPALSVLGPEHAQAIGYGYATTVPYLRSWPLGPETGAATAGTGALFVLGDPFQLGSRGSVAGPAWVTLAGPGLPAPGPGGAVARYRAGIAELATGWPDKEMLERAGPRPLDATGHRRWSRLVTDCALERHFGIGRASTGTESLRLADSHDRPLPEAARAASPSSPSRPKDRAVRAMGL